MSKAIPTKPVMIILYGFPGAGKTFFARQLCGQISAAHVQADRIRDELFEKPKYDKQEDNITNHLAEYMTEEFLNLGVSVVVDLNANRLVQRRALRDIARRSKAQPLLVWLQIDPETSFLRTTKRDRRRSDDKYARVFTRAEFDQYIARMQNPQSEECIVISGKHPFATQKGPLMKKMYDLGLLHVEKYSNHVAKPQLVNLVPNPSAGRVDMSRRSISIR
jgi:predicted kinase